MTLSWSSFAQRIAHLKSERFANLNYPLRSNLGVRINDFAQRNAQPKADLICDLSLPDNVGEDTTFLGCPFIRSSG